MMSTSNNNYGSNNQNSDVPSSDIQQPDHPSPALQAFKKARAGERCEQQQQQLDESLVPPEVVSSSYLPSTTNGVNVKIEEDSNSIHAYLPSTTNGVNVKIEDDSSIHVDLPSTTNGVNVKIEDDSSSIHADLPSTTNAINVKIEEDSSINGNDNERGSNNGDSAPIQHETALPSATIPQLVATAVPATATVPAVSTSWTTASATQATTATNGNMNSNSSGDATTLPHDTALASRTTHPNIAPASSVSTSATTTAKARQATTAVDTGITTSLTKQNTPRLFPQVKDVITCLDVLHDASTVQEATNAIKFLETIPRLSQVEQKVYAQQFHDSHGLFILTSSLNNYYESKQFVSVTFGALYSILWYDTRSQMFLLNKTQGRTLGVITKAAIQHRTGGNGNNGSDMVEQMIQCNAVGIMLCSAILQNTINMENDTVLFGFGPLDKACIDFVVETMGLYPFSKLVQAKCVVYFYQLTNPTRLSTSTTPTPTQSIRYLLTKGVHHLLLAAHNFFRSNMIYFTSEGDEQVVRCAREALNRLL